MKEHTPIIKKIWEDTGLLTQEERIHIEQCDICKNEYMMALKIEESLQNLPEIEVSPNIRSVIYLMKIKPYYSIWRLGFIGFIIVSLPFVFQIDLFSIYLNRNLINFLVLMSIVLHMVIILILSYYLFFKYFNKIENFSEKIDIFLEKTLMKNEK